MADFELHGYLTTGKFQVNDYKIEIERVDGEEGKGVRLKITDGNGEVKQAIVKDGDPEMTAEEIAELRDIYERMTRAYPEWADKELARQKAEKERAAAEDGRKSAFQQMQSMIAALDIDAINNRVDDAVNAANSAKGYADDAATNTYNSLYDQIYYKAGDTITIGEILGNSHSLCVVGYCTADRTEVHLKMPVAKRLDNVSMAVCNSFRVHLVNAGGYGQNTGYHNGGTQYATANMTTYVDKVQNCIHIKLTKADGFHLTANDCVSARVGSDYGVVPAVMFTLA